MATNSVERWDEPVQELVAGILADGLSDADPGRLDASRGKRDRLTAELVERCNESTLHFGVRIRAIWFTNFIRNAPSYRLIGGVGMM